MYRIKFLGDHLKFKDVLDSGKYGIYFLKDFAILEHGTAQIIKH